ncbi:hypothetical protein [Paraburkholderia silvatlantica]|uniref:hypothetical protein n=1 Tax=Paraburkholderia silvatlantica TaxID=321895 RepID=UPI003753341E
MTATYVRPEITPGLRDAMNRVGAVLDDVFKGKGFALLVFDFGSPEGNPGMMNFLSNADRDDLLCAMREFIAANEGRAHDEPRGLQ